MLLYPRRVEGSEANRMMKMNRLVWSTGLGIVAGIICWIFTSTSPSMPASLLTLPLAISIVMNRTLLGFAIGISGWKDLNYLVHGALMGAVFSMPMALFAEPVAAALTMIAGVAYGVGIEYVVTKVLKQPMKA